MERTECVTLFTIIYPAPLRKRFYVGEKDRLAREKPEKAAGLLQRAGWSVTLRVESGWAHNPKYDEWRTLMLDEILPWMTKR